MNGYEQTFSWPENYHKWLEHVLRLGPASRLMCSIGTITIAVSAERRERSEGILPDTAHAMRMPRVKRW